MNGRILVTGASGFVGRQTLAPLQKLGFEVHAVSRKPLEKTAGVVWHSCDLLDKKAASELIKKVKPSHLLHSAWVTEHGKFWQAPENQDWLAASKYLFESFAANGGKRIIGVGTCVEYDWQRRDQKPWKETDSCKPHTPYGKAKLELCDWLQDFSAREGISHAWARLFLLFGPYENPQRIIPYIITSALKGEAPKCSSGNQIRDFIDTGTCGKMLAKIAESDLTGPVNVGSGKGCSLKDMAQKIFDIMKKPDNCQFGALQDRPDDPLYMVANIEKLRQVIPLEYDINTALVNAISWWKNQGIN